MTISLPQPQLPDPSAPQPVTRTARPPLVVVRDLPEVVRSPEPGRETAGTCVRIGPFDVLDRNEHDTVESIVEGALSVSTSTRAWITYALHVGGLNSRRDETFVDAMSGADLVYADGMSVVLLARLGGAEEIERCGTTDIGWGVLRRLSEELGRPARVALIGGPDGLTRRAGDVLEAEAGVEVVLTENGYHDDWSAVLTRLALSRCDVLFVGLGAPYEMKWVEENRHLLPPCLVMTCGGWFGFITEDEKRAPRWLCRVGLEWTYRLVQAPNRLWRRYAAGALSTGLLALSMSVNRTAPDSERAAIS